MDALLITFGSSHHIEALEGFKNYLKTEAGLASVGILGTSLLSSEKVLEAVDSGLKNANTARPFLLAYVGHGGPDGWAINYTRVLGSEIWQTVLYEDIAKILKHHNRPVMFLNTCCYARSVVGYLEKQGVSNKDISLIAACREDQETDITMMGRITRSWRHKSEHVSTSRAVTIFDIKAGKEEGRVGRCRIMFSEFLNRMFPRLFTTIYGGKMGESKFTLEDSIRVDSEVRWGASFDHYFFSKQAGKPVYKREVVYLEPRF